MYHVTALSNGTEKKQIITVDGNGSHSLQQQIRTVFGYEEATQLTMQIWNDDFSDWVDAGWETEMPARAKLRVISGPCEQPKHKDACEKQTKMPTSSETLAR